MSTIRIVTRVVVCTWGLTVGLSAAEQCDTRAVSLKAEGKHREAIATYLESLQQRRAVLGERHQLVAVSTNNLAVVYHRLGDFSAAESLYQQSGRIAKTVLGERHPTTAATLHNLAVLYSEHREYEKAEQYYRECIDICMLALGDQHSNTIGAFNSLGLLHEAQGRFEKAEQVFLKVFELRKRTVGEHDSDTDAALQLSEAERVLLRAHPVITSKEVLEVAVRLVIASRDDATLDRLERFVKQHDMAAFGQRFAARKLAGEARADDPPLLIHVEEVSAEAYSQYHAIVAEIKTASYRGDRTTLKSIEEQLDAVSALTEKQKEDLRSFISTRDIAAGGAEESPLVATLDQLMSGSRQGGFSLVGDSNKLSSFPIYKQPDGISCGPTCCAMVLNYYGKSAGVGPLKTQAGTRHYAGPNLTGRQIQVGLTLPSGMQRALSAYGVPAYVRRGSISDIKSYVDEKRPPILLIRSGRDTWHYVVATGYMHDGSYIRLADPAGKEYWMRNGDLEAVWRYSHKLGPAASDPHFSPGVVTAVPVTDPSCGVCGGDGNLVRTNCGSCGGSGRISYKEKLTGRTFWTKCPTCNGVGIWSSKCHVCGGDGRETDAYRKLVEGVGASGHTLIVPQSGNRPSQSGAIVFDEQEHVATYYTVVALKNATSQNVNYNLRWSSGAWQRNALQQGQSRWHWSKGHSQRAEVSFDCDLTSSSRVITAGLTGKNVLLPQALAFR